MHPYILVVSESAARARESGLYLGDVGVSPRTFVAGGHTFTVEEAWLERGRYSWEVLVEDQPPLWDGRTALGRWLNRWLRWRPSKDARRAPPYVLAFRLTSPTAPESRDTAPDGLDILLSWGDGTRKQALRPRVNHREAGDPLPTGARAAIEHRLDNGPPAVLTFTYPRLPPPTG